MSRFKVTEILDPGTIVVSPTWKWQEDVGMSIRPTGYVCPNCPSPAYESAMKRLKNLIYGKSIELRKAYRVDQGKLVCDVFINGINLSDFFPDFK
jgi:hypothetical protein